MGEMGDTDTEKCPGLFDAAGEIMTDSLSERPADLRTAPRPDLRPPDEIIIPQFRPRQSLNPMVLPFAAGLKADS